MLRFTSWCALLALATLWALQNHFWEFSKMSKHQNIDAEGRSKTSCQQAVHLVCYFIRRHSRYRQVTVLGTYFSLFTKAVGLSQYHILHAWQSPPFQFTNCLYSALHLYFMNLAVTYWGHFWFSCKLRSCSRTCECAVSTKAKQYCR